MAQHIKNKKEMNEKSRSTWGLILQALIAVLTALSGVFVGCSLHP